MSNKRKVPAKGQSVNTPADQGSLFDVLPAPIIAMPLDAAPSTAEVAAEAQQRITVLPGEPSRTVKRLVDARGEISSTVVDKRDYHHTSMAQISLPYSKPADNVRVWDRRNGSAALRIFAGSVPDHEERYHDVPLPYGAKARLILIYLNTMAKKLRSPEIPIGDSMTGFFKSLIGRDPNSRDIASMKDQLISIAAASITVGLFEGDGCTIMHSNFIEEFKIRFKGPNKLIWPENVTLNGKYFSSLMDHAIPLDHRAVTALSHNALALDIYTWLAQRLYRIGDKPQFLGWQTLKEQFGPEYGQIKNFRRDFRTALMQVMSVYPAAHIEEIEEGAIPRGLNLYQSPPPVPTLEPKLIG